VVLLSPESPVSIPRPALQRCQPSDIKAPDLERHPALAGVAVELSVPRSCFARVNTTN
jgi:hypothetical protein